ncbi:MAG: hypothetical protein V8R61_02805 [Enterocloster sp.]
MNDFLYGNSAVGASEGTKVYEDEQEINEKFGRSNMLVALYPFLGDGKGVMTDRGRAALCEKS